MQSAALALISCEQTRGEIVHTEMPRYDAIIYWRPVHRTGVGPGTGQVY